MTSTVHYTDIVRARSCGVILTTRPDVISYLADRAVAECAGTGKIIFRDNILWVTDMLRKNDIRIVGRK